jgi:uncharacterized protein
MTTYDPDTMQQNPFVLRDIVRKFGGTLALDTAVIKPGRIAVGDKVELLAQEPLEEIQPLTTETLRH